MGRTALHVFLYFCSSTTAFCYNPGRCPDMNHVFVDYDTSLKIADVLWYEWFAYDNQNNDLDFCTRYIISFTGNKLIEDKVRTGNSSDFTFISTVYSMFLYDETDFGHFWVNVTEFYQTTQRNTHPHPYNSSLADKKLNAKIVYYDKNYMAWWSCEQIDEKKHSIVLRILTSNPSTITNETLFRELEQLLGLNTSALQIRDHSEAACSYYVPEAPKINYEENEDSAGHIINPGLIAYLLIVCSCDICLYHICNA